MLSKTARAWLIGVVLVSLAVWAGSPVGASVTAGATGSPPPAITSGVKLIGSTAIRVRVSAAAGNVSGGKVCAFYLPQGSTLATQWVRSPNLDLTLPSSATELDAGIVRALVLPDLAVVGQFGRVSYVPCALTGTADDAGTNSYTVTTESWGPSYP